MSRRKRSRNRNNATVPSSQPVHTVFVYGSLKTGRGNHRLLEDSKQISVGYVRGEMEMVSLGAFPAVVAKTGADNMIYGEVYEVDQQTMDALDMLEGYPDFYTRSVHTVRNDGVATYRAWMYTLPGGAPPHTEPVTSGVWRGTPAEYKIMGEFVNAAREDITI